MAPPSRSITRDHLSRGSSASSNEHDDSSAEVAGRERTTSEESADSVLGPYLPERWRQARVDPGRRGALALCGVGLIVLVFAGYAWLRDSPDVTPVPALPVVQPLSTEPSVVPTSAAPAAPMDLVVSVVGLVAAPGLVHLPPGARVADALDAAGGPLVGADVVALNLAAKVSDEDQIVVGTLPPEGRPVVSGTVRGADTSPPAPGIAGADGAATGADPVGPAPVNLNTATVQELDALNGVGPVTAAAIIAWRETNGAFTDVGQLAEVDGIGHVRLEKLRGQVAV